MRILAIVSITACGGGIARDPCIGAIPPARLFDVIGPGLFPLCFVLRFLPLHLHRNLPRFGRARAA